MAWMIGRKSDQSIVEITENTSFDTSNPLVNLERLETIFPQKFGGVKEDYSFFNIPSIDHEKLRDGWQYTIVWTGAIITSIDFTPETSKNWIKLITDKTNILGDGIDVATITLEFWRPNLSSIMTTVNMTARRVSIITPNGIRFVRLNIVNGIARARFRCTQAGEYIFPAEPKRYGTSRIFNQIKIEVDDVSLLELF